MRDAWQRLYAKHGVQYGGTGDLGLLEPHLKTGMLVLDAGCGDGKTTEMLARKYDVVGCDFSREGLLALRTNRDPMMRVNLVECNMANLPFEREKFDAVCCIHALSHMHADERIRAAAQIASVIKKGGYLLLEGFGPGDIRFGEGRAIEDSTFLRGNGILTHYFREGEVRDLFPEMEVLGEFLSSKRVSYGAISGKRETLRALMRRRLE
jgi:SAM-dependent methyltransferase